MNTPLSYLFPPVYDMAKGKFVNLGARGKKKDWADRFFGKKLSKRDKFLFKGVIYGASAVALLGAGSTVASGFKK